ncbi:MAG: hypothetical protein FWG30_10980 [Eubacteriaceae bacterium]|nr:hypothetical protein [Eubacteriaceae bacterium]
MENQHKTVRFISMRALINTPLLWLKMRLPDKELIIENQNGALEECTKMISSNVGVRTWDRDEALDKYEKIKKNLEPVEKQDIKDLIHNNNIDEVNKRLEKYANNLADSNVLIFLFQENLNQFRHVEMERMAFTALFIGAMIAFFALVNELTAKGFNEILYTFIFLVLALTSYAFWLCSFLLCKRWNTVFDNHRNQARNMHDMLIANEISKGRKMPEGLLFPFKANNDEGAKYTSTAKLFEQLYWVLLTFMSIIWLYFTIKAIQQYSGAS